MAEPTLNVKLRLISEWLKTVFQSELIPAFSQTNENIDKLYSLMIAQRSYEHDVKRFDEYLQKSSEEYATDAQNSFTALHRLGLKPEEFSDKLQERLGILATLAGTLKLADVQQSSYMLALTDLALKQEKVQSAFEEETQAVADLDAEITEALLMVEKLDRCVAKQAEDSTAKQAKAAEQSQQISFLNQKIVKYQEDIALGEQTLATAGMHAGLRHENLLTAYEELDALKNALREREEQLRVYADLPPDRDLANVKLEMKKAELREVEAELARQIDMSHL